MITSYPKVSLIVVNYNGKRFLAPLFESLFNLDFPLDRLEFIVVDNGSNDGSQEFIKRFSHSIKLLINDENNYCKANNVGIENSSGEYIGLLNNDLVLDRNWLKELVKLMQTDSRIGASMGKTLFPDARLQATGNISLPDFYWSERGFKEDDIGQYEQVQEMETISHCVILYRRECLDDTGSLDNDFNIYFEDIDMSIRAKAKSWKLFYAPKALTYHHRNGSMKAADDITFLCERNRLFILAKHYPWQLASALNGNGYFMDLTNRHNLITVLPHLSAKLLKHHPRDLAMSVLAQVYESLAQTVKSAMLDKQYEINNLSDVISRDKEEIGVLESELKCILNSRVYRFISRPLSRIFSLIKTNALFRRCCGK